MKLIATLAVTILSLSAFAQEAVVDVTLRPAGAFKGTSKEVKGTAVQKGDTVEAQNIIVSLKNIQTGIGLRDQHTKKHLEVEKFPEAVLVSAKGKDGKGEGLIRIRGIEKKIAGTYQIEGNQLKADFPIKFSDFGISGVKYMGVGVDDNGMIHVSVPYKK
jgi:polyisoprenoid-binding protein YceI